LDHIVHRAIVSVIAFASGLGSAVAEIICVAGAVEVSISKGSCACAVALDEVVYCAWVVVIAGSARLRARAKVIRVTGAIAIAIGEGARACAVALDEIVDCAWVSIIAR
jgi:hypothetical protein